MVNITWQAPGLKDKFEYEKSGQKAFVQDFPLGSGLLK